MDGAPPHPHPSTSESYEVAYADTDAGGIVYHARDVEMAERSRNRLLRTLGLPVAEMKACFGVLFIIREVRAVYHRPALVGDILSLTSGIVADNAVRATWRTVIERDGTPICDIEAQLAAYDPVQGGPCLLPQRLIERLADAPRLSAMRRGAAMKPGAA